MTGIHEAEEFLNRIPYFTKKHPPAHTQALLHALGDPQESFDVIHAAGSNGKGSVCAFLFHILKEAGCKAGLFVSPHLTDIRERFVTANCLPGEADGSGTGTISSGTDFTETLEAAGSGAGTMFPEADFTEALEAAGSGAGMMFSEADFMEAFETVRIQAERMEAAGEEYPTYFEYLFAVGMLLFQKAGVQITVIETGMGGRLDCTNIIRRPLAAVITSISLEHRQYLGDTIREIAAEKAGIIKPGVPVVFDGSDPEAAAVLRAEADRRGAPVTEITKDRLIIKNQTENGIEFCLRSIYDRDTADEDAAALGGRQQPETARGRDCPVWQIPFCARYQVMNAALAMSVCRICFPEMDTAVIAAGLAHTRWPGRMQQLLPGIWLDGAHNPDGIRRFAETVRDLCGADPVLPDGSGADRSGEDIPKEDAKTAQRMAARPVLLFSMVEGKDYAQAVRVLCENITWGTVILTRIPSERGMDPLILQREFLKNGQADVRVIEDHAKAFGQIVSRHLKSKQQGKIFCAGSLYFAGALLKEAEKYYVEF